MHLSQLSIKNFRAFDEVTLNFKKGVNILIGENNSGKSAIIDALRICLGYSKPENNLYIQETDLHLNPNDPTEKNSIIQFDLVFEFGKNSIKERECFNDFISQDPKDSSKQTIQFHLKYTLEDKGKRKFFKRSVWGGDNEGQQIPYEALQEIFFTYLSPLRDAVTGLKPYSYDNKTAQLFNQLTKYNKNGTKDIPLDDKKKESLANELYSLFESDNNDWKFILKTGNEKVNVHLTGTGIKNKNPEIDMKYVGRKYSDVVRGIELKRPIYEKGKVKEEEQKYFELSQNGLGENNLIYASVVLGDLINRCQDEDLEIYIALLVEEPEAHLHPQYQNTFFEYLNRLENEELQIFITSHSPTITAKSDTKNLIILQKQNHKISPFSFASLTEEDFSPENRKYLRKFLDVTKSQMFFADGVLLVEGISEAILIPLLSKRFCEVDLEKRGIEIVNIGGVAFEHFAKLYNNEDEVKRLLSKCAIITDSDPKGSKPKSYRAVKTEAYEKNNLIVRLATHTFEYDLFNVSKKNKKIMQEVYRNMHNGTPELKGDYSAKTLFKKLKLNEDKADFALELFNRLEKETTFDVPSYISEAIEFVVNAKKHVPKTVL